jgi:hypothetical protein
MIGTSSQEDKQMLRQAQIAKYLNLLYEDSFQDWQKKRHDQLLHLARHALALQKFRLERMPPGATGLETFADFRDQAKLGTNGEKDGQTSSTAVMNFNEWGPAWSRRGGRRRRRGGNFKLVLHFRRHRQRRLTRVRTGWWIRLVKK